MSNKIRVFVPRDSAALAVGADEVAQALQAAAGDAIELVRNGSRGLFWLEPLVEVQTPAGRVAYGPVNPKTCPACWPPACCRAVSTRCARASPNRFRTWHCKSASPSAAW